MRIGGYEILSPLGAGGMGEVYRAKDVRLGRDVAIKILPTAFTDRDRLARFEREARVLASLNHPHIAAIYGVESAPISPPESGQLTALVLELVEGETLAERIGSRARTRSTGLPLREALEIARQIADTLNAAHDKGIVHRDLKPANVMITRDGAVKVVDFGLAKDTDSVGTAGAHLPTMTVEATQWGMLLGTAAYMSPEQARGQPIDERTDIWALGCVLYEMLTGTNAFGGETFSDVLAGIIEREPDWSLLPSVTPESIVRLVKRCLRKSVHERLRDMADVAILLDDALADSATVAPSSSPARDSSPRRRGIRSAGVAIIAAAVGVAGAFGWSDVMLRRSSLPALEPLSRLTSDAGLSTEPTLSDDGRLVAYASTRSGAGNLDIYVQQTSGPAIRLTDDPADDRDPDVSPDGSRIAFQSARTPGGIYVASALGGEARLIATDGFAPKSSPDGEMIAFWTGNWFGARSINLPQSTFVVAAAGATPRRVAVNIASAGHPVWSPDGRSLLVFGREATSGPNTEADWWWVPLDTGLAVQTGVFARFQQARLRLAELRTVPYPQAWTDDGVFFAAEGGNGDTRSLWLVGIDQRSGQVARDVVRLTTGSTSDASVDVSPSGHVVLAAETFARVTFALPLDENNGRVIGPLRRVRQDNTPTGRVSVAADGLTMAVPLIEPATAGIWIRDAMGRERQLVVTPRTPLNPVISLDGRSIGYTVSKADTGGGSGPGDGFIVSADGGIPRKVCEMCIVENWTRDNRTLVIREPGQSALFRLDVATGARVPLAVAARGDFDRPMLAPNGRWVSFNVGPDSYTGPVHGDRATTESEWTRVFERTPAATAERTAGLSSDGSLLYVLLGRDGFRCLYAVRVERETGRPQGEPFPVAHFHDATKAFASTAMGSAVARGVFLMDLFDISGDVWMTTLTQPR
jgi:serine/threonine protein kinase